MRRATRLLKLLTVMTVLFLAACGGPQLTDKGKNVSEANWTVADFSYTNQNGDTVSLSDLKGEVWLANFFFSSCTTVCPVLTAHMAKLQKQLKEEEVSIPIVSFTVDPERDKPEKLRVFGEKHGADFSTWSFLTGYSFEEVQRLSMESFKSAIGKPPEGSDQFSHGVSFYLIKSDKIIKSYNGVSDTPYDAIVTDVKALLDE